MNGDDDDPVLEQALRERLGGETPPDLVSSVRARLHGVPPVAASGQRLLVAAAIVIGCAVVTGVALWRPAAERAEATPPAGQEPIHQVGSVGDAASLPVDTRAVEVVGGDDHVIEKLTRLRDLEVLVVSEPWNNAYGLSPKMQAGVIACPVTNVSWQYVARFTKLRRLEFSGVSRIARLTGPSGADVVTMLERLPLLETLSLRFLHASNEVLERLPRLPQLKHLDLSFNHGFTEEGVAAIAKCAALRSLSLRGCQQLHAAWFGHLKSLAALERLDVSLIDGMNWWNGTGVVDDHDREVLRKARGWADSLNGGVQDSALTELAKLPRLRVLEIGGGRWTPFGIHALRDCTALEELGMAGGNTTGDAGLAASLPPNLKRLEVCGLYGDQFCAALRERLPHLRDLCVAACDQITDAGLRELVAMPSLRVLDLRQMRGLTAACVDVLAAARQLEVVDLRHCPCIAPEHVERLRRELPSLRVLDTSAAASERR